MKRKESIINNYANSKMGNIIWKDRKRTIFGLPISFTKYTLTEEKLVIDTGFFTKIQEEVRLYRMTDFSIKQTIFDRIFNVGRINISSSDNTQGEFTLLGVKKPYVVKEILSDYVEKEREKKGIVTNVLRSTKLSV